MPIYKNDGTKFGFKHPNGTFTGALNSLSQRKSHAAFVTFFVKDYETRNIEFSASVYSDDLCLIVKKAERIPTFMLPLITFDRSLWIALGVFCVLGENLLESSESKHLSRVAFTKLHYMTSELKRRFFQLETVLFPELFL